MTDLPTQPLDDPQAFKFCPRPVGDSLWHVESFGSSMVRARVAQAAIVAHCQQQGFPEEDLFAIRLALEEALINAVKHGNKLDPSKIVRVRYRVTETELEVAIEDEGAGFNPAALPDPTLDENLCMTAGRGILLMRAYMDAVVYSPKGTCVTLTKRKTP